MTTNCVSGVFLLFQVDNDNLTQPQPTLLLALRRSVSGVSGLTRAQAYAPSQQLISKHEAFCFFMREELPNTLNTPDTVVLKRCYIWFLCVSGLCRVVGFLCRVRFVRGIGQ